MGKFLVAGFLALCVIAGIAYFQMYQHADEVNRRIEREALGQFNRAQGLPSIENKIREIMKEENVDLVENSLKCDIIDSVRGQTADLVGIARPNSGSKAVLVTSTFKAHRFFFSKTYTRQAKKDLYGGNDRPGDTRSNRGSFGGVRLGGKSRSRARDVNSHRSSVRKAVSGGMP